MSPAQRSLTWGSCECDLSKEEKMHLKQDAYNAHLLLIKEEKEMLGSGSHFEALNYGLKSFPLSPVIGLYKAMGFWNAQSTTASPIFATILALGASLKNQDNREYVRERKPMVATG